MISKATCQNYDEHPSKDARVKMSKCQLFTVGQTRATITIIVINIMISTNYFRSDDGGVTWGNVTWPVPPIPTGANPC